MAEVIPIATNPAPVRSLPIPQTGAVRRSVGHWTDTRGRPLRDLRISVTDHCNFRCRYCMPKEKFSNPHAFLAHTELLTFEEILRIARIVVANGVEKLRLTGGEPLLRKGPGEAAVVVAQCQLLPAGELRRGERSGGAASAGLKFLKIFWKNVQQNRCSNRLIGTGTKNAPRGAEGVMCV